MSTPYLVNLEWASPDGRVYRLHFLNRGDTVTKLKHGFIYSFINMVVFTGII